MAILGFFSRKSKSKASSSQASSSVVQGEAGSAEDYILSPPSAAVPSVGNGDDGYTSSGASFVSAASSKKARLPFSKKSSAAASSPLARPYGPPRGVPDVSTDKLSLSLETSLNSLPTRTSVFPSFHGSNSSPTLTRLSATDVLDRPQPNPVQKKELPENPKSGGGLFAWRERKKSRPSKPEAETLPLPPLNDESFNLKAFRHVLPEPRPESPNGSFTQSSPMSLVPPPRPRGGSMASTDSSQRISVAAFREAQARRSSTNLASGTPSSTIRPVSGVGSMGSVSDVAPPRPPRALRPPSSATTARDVKLLPSRPPTRASSSSSSSSSEESESDDCSPSRSRSRLSRQLTITKQSYRAKSDLGHGAIPPDSSHHRQSTSTRSELGHGLPTSSKQPSPTNAPPPSSFQQTSDASVGTRSFSLYRRQQASHSTSELNPSAAAQRANVLMEANKRDVQAVPRQSLSSTDTSDSDSEGDSSDDNAPLSALKQSKGSDSASRTNYSVSAMIRKPLIDLNLKSNPLSGKPVPTDTSRADREKARLALISPTNINGRLSQLTAAAGLVEHRSTSASKSEANLSRVVIPKAPHIRDSKAASPVSSGTVSPPLRTTSPEMITPNAHKLSFSPSSPLPSPEISQDLTQTQIDGRRFFEVDTGW
ncbi:hypothetical protein M0805_002423 [Coniferiporia weirii]|nr:hypothetical protein M0805_002423 [Coniferiporia weirii]